MLLDSRNQIDQVVDGHEVLFRLECATMAKNLFGGPEHRRVCAAQQMIRVDDDANTVPSKLVIPRAVVRRWNYEQGSALRKFSVVFAERDHFRTRLFVAVDHEPIGARFDISIRAAKRVFMAFIQNETFNAGEDHKLAGDLRPFSGRYLARETFDGVLCLIRIVQQRIPF
jgi:hypothetical protein